MRKSAIEGFSGCGLPDGFGILVAIYYRFAQHFSCSLLDTMEKEYEVMR